MHDITGEGNFTTGTCTFNKEDKTIATNKSMTSKQLEKYLNNINSNVFQPVNSNLEIWEPYIGKCPHCGSANIEANHSMVLATMPPQYSCRCKDCGKGFCSGEIKVEPVQVPTLPKEPSTVIPGYVPPEIYKPNYGYGNYGWICPKCGKVNAPHRDFCDCSGGGYYPNIVYCNGSGNNPNPAPTTTISDSALSRATSISEGVVTYGFEACNLNENKENKND